MRIRQIKPSWWLDKDLRTRLNADAREFYIGLWMVADDGGWFDWDVTRIAAELYPYGTNGAGLFDTDPFVKREQDVAAWGAMLAGMCPARPHLVIYPCGHARVPKIADHQRYGGRPVYTVGRAHERDCARTRADARTLPTGNGTERKGTVVPEARNSAPDDEKTLRELVPLTPEVRELLRPGTPAPKPVRAKR